MARNSRRHPLRIFVVPNGPLVPIRNPAFMPKDETHSAKELVDIKLERLCQPQVVAIEIDVVREVVDRRNQAAFAVHSSLRRERPDEVVVPQSVRIRSTAAKIELRGRAAL